MYNVTLTNRDSIFDSACGFETVAEALEWASGRGGRYVVQIDNGRPCADFSFISISAEDFDGVTRFQRSTPAGWEYISVDQIAALV